MKLIYYNPFYYRFTFISRCSEAAIFLMKSFMIRLNSSKDAKILVTSMVCLFLHLLYKANTYGEKTNDQESLCHVLRDNTRELLKTWVVHPDVIGGSFFGGEVIAGRRTIQKLKNESKELKV